MIPSLEVVIAAHRFLCRRHQLEVPFPEQSIRNALVEAQLLAQNEREEPAAMFFVMSQRARVLQALWTVLPHVLAFNQASGVGLRLDASTEELRRVRLDVAARNLSYQDVAAWFETRLQTIA